MKKYLLSFLILFFFVFIVYAQTGNFTDHLIFNGEERGVSGFVPTDYDSSQSLSLMICLHGAQDDCENYRNALIQSFHWDDVFPNTIFLCPDGGSDMLSSFSDPPDDEEIIQVAIDYALDHFNIDTQNIILQGFSLGGRSALKYGLDHPEKFKGLLLNTPAVQGLADALNEIPFVGQYYNYENASDLKVYMTCGKNDEIFMMTIDPLVEQLKRNNCTLKYTVVNGLSHSIPNGSIVGAAIPFFENPAVSDHSIDLFKIETEDRYCDATMAPTVVLRNTGSSVITSIDMDYELNNQNGSYTWTGSLDPYEHASIDMPTMTGIEGENSLKVTIGMLNGMYPDTITDDNEVEKAFVVETFGKPLPIEEGFENDAESWIFPETGSPFGWEEVGHVAHTGTHSMWSFNTILIFYTDGDRCEFLSPVVDLSSVDHPQIAFDYAFNYHKYTPPYFAKDTLFADTLEISVSFDCGETFQTLFYKGGADLATVATPIINPLNIGDCWFKPKKNEWRTKVIDLEQFSDQTEAIFKFSYISNLGGCIYIDNVIVDKDAEVREDDQPRENALTIFPNPATDRITVTTAEEKITSVEIFDLLGNKVLHSSSSDDIDVRFLPKGFYLLRVLTEEGGIGQAKWVKR